MSNWAAPALNRLPFPGSAGVDLWLAGPSSTGAVPEQCWATLSANEKNRADRFVRPEDRALFVMTRGSLRFLLGAATGLAAEAVAFEEGPFGKPYLSGINGPHFNVSHSGAFALIGLSESRPIGVDIELMRRSGDELNVARRFFSAAEFRALQSQETETMLSAFFKIWTCKEAVLKARGVGISEHLKHFSVELTPDGFAIHPDPKWIPGAAITANQVVVPPGYAGCCALA